MVPVDEHCVVVQAANSHEMSEPHGVSVGKCFVCHKEVFYGTPAVVYRCEFGDHEQVAHQLCAVSQQMKVQ